MSLRIRDIEQMRATQTACIPAGNTTPSVYIIPDINPTGTVWSGKATSVKVSIKIVKPSEVISLIIEDSPDLPYRILRPIPVIIEKDDGCMIASFNEANVHASGDTMERALTNLKTYIGDVLDELLEVGAEGLGVALRCEFTTLQTYIQKRNA